MINRTTTNATMTSGSMSNGNMGMGNRDQVTQWQGTHNWDDIDKAVDDENQLKVAARFLPPCPLPGATSALRGIINGNNNAILSIQQSDMMPLIEIGVQFALTNAQMKDEAQSKMGGTLTHRAGSLLALAEDLVLFQGDTGLGDSVFQTVQTDGSDAGTGLVFASLPKDQVIPVFPTEVADDPSQNKYGENTFAAVADAFARLQKTHYGRCAVVLHTNVYADTYAALPTTLAVPAERIKGLVSEHFYVSSALPPFTGVVVAIDGDTMDLVTGQAPFTEFTQVNNSQWIFRLYERIGLRLKDPTAVVRLEFQLKKKDGIK
jgi:uncharacterized linocin/CFP29 family protein